MEVGEGVVGGESAVEVVFGGRGGEDCEGEGGGGEGLGGEHVEEGEEVSGRGVWLCAPGGGVAGHGEDEEGGRCGDEVVGTDEVLDGVGGVVVDCFSPFKLGWCCKDFMFIGSLQLATGVRR